MDGFCELSGSGVSAWLWSYQVVGRLAAEEAGDALDGHSLLPTGPEGKGWPPWTRLVLLPGSSYAL